MEIKSGSTAVVTGAASGIGNAMARLFVAQGMNVVLADIEQQALDNAVDELELGGAKVLGVQCDVASAESVESLAQQAFATFGGVQLLCNNAGVFAAGASWESSIAEYRWLYDVNVIGIANALHSFVPRMMASSEPSHIVNTASMAGLTTMPFSAVYCATKAAALHLTECLHKELEATAPHIGVSVLCPEGINTAIGHSERNRPVDYAQDGDVTATDFGQMTTDALRDMTRDGLDPMVMAERVLQGVKDGKFYLLATDHWKDISDHRLDEVRSATNPTLFFPEQ